MWIACICRSLQDFAFFQMTDGLQTHRLGGETCEDFRAIWSSFEQFQSWGCPGCPIIFGRHCGIFCPNLHKKVLDLRATLWPELAVVDGYWWYPMMGHGMNFAAEITDNLRRVLVIQEWILIMTVNHPFSREKVMTHTPVASTSRRSWMDTTDTTSNEFQWYQMVLSLEYMISLDAWYHIIQWYHIYITITYGCTVAWLPSLI